MKDITYKSVNKTEVLDKIFCFLVERGLENVSIRELSRGTGMAQGSLYYWFDGKTSIICESTKFGFKKIIDEIFDYVFDSINNLPEFFSNCLEKISKYQNELCFIYQMAASPVYGQKIQTNSVYTKYMYDKYAERLANILKCDTQSICPIVYLFVSAVCNYVIWKDKTRAQAEIDFVYSALLNVMNTSSNLKGAKNGNSSNNR